MTAPDREREAREKVTVARSTVWRRILDLNHACTREDVEAALDEHARAIESFVRDTERSAWRTAIEGMRKGHSTGCIEDEYGWLCVCGGNDWNAALAALAERMGNT